MEISNYRYTMKNLLLLITMILFSGLANAQSQIALPPGTKPYSSNIFKAPDRTIWTGKPGDYSPLANGFYVDSVINTIPSKVIVTTASLKINEINTNPEWARLPVSNTSGTQLVQGGIIAGYAVNQFTNNGIVKRLNGKSQFVNGTNTLDAVNKGQLDSLAATAVEKRSTFSPITNNRNSLILSSDFSNIISTDATASHNNMILSSNNVFIQGDSLTYNNIIGSVNSRIGNKRKTSAIIASYNSEITDAQIGDGFVKWNSAIIAALNAKVGRSNSYALVTGQGTESSGSATLTMGLYNIVDPLRSVTDPLKKTLTIGNGGNTQALERSNAFYVTHGGRAWVQNEFEVDKAGGAVILKSPDGKRWQIKVSNTGTLTTTVLP